MIIELVIIYLLYHIIIILGSYYVDLFLSKEQYTKSEITNSLPYFTKLLKVIKHKFSIPNLIIILFASSSIGIAIPFILKHWFTNSSIIFTLLFFILPLLKNQLEKYQVSDSENPLDIFSNIIIKYDAIILIGFGSGTGSTLILNWGAVKAVPFLWFLVNIVIISILLGITIYKLLKK